MQIIQTGKSLISRKNHQNIEKSKKMNIEQKTNLNSLDTLRIGFLFILRLKENTSTSSQSNTKYLYCYKIDRKKNCITMISFSNKKFFSLPN